MISKTSLYLIKALTEIARLPKGDFIGAGELAKKTEVPANYLSKSLRTLAQRGLLDSRKGKGGGFALTKKTRRLPLLTIVEAVDDMKRWARCFLDFKKCRDARPCALHEEWKVVRGRYLQFLDSHTIEDCL